MRFSSSRKTNYPEVMQRYRTTKETKYQKQPGKNDMNIIAIVSLQ